MPPSVEEGIRYGIRAMSGKVSELARGGGRVQQVGSGQISNPLPLSTRIGGKMLVCKTDDFENFVPSQPDTTFVGSTINLR